MKVYTYKWIDNVKHILFTDCAASIVADALDFYLSDFMWKLGNDTFNHNGSPIDCLSYPVDSDATLEVLDKALQSHSYEKLSLF